MDDLHTQLPGYDLLNVDTFVALILGLQVHRRWEIHVVQEAVMACALDNAFPELRLMTFHSD